MNKHHVSELNQGEYYQGYKGIRSWTFPMMIHKIAQKEIVKTSRLLEIKFIDT